MMILCDARFTIHTSSVDSDVMCGEGRVWSVGGERKSGEQLRFALCGQRIGYVAVRLLSKRLVDVRVCVCMTNCGQPYKSRI